MEWENYYLRLLACWFWPSRPVPPRCCDSPRPAARDGELGFIDYDSSVFDGTANQRVTNDNILDIRFVDPVTGLVIDMAGPPDQSTIFDSTGALPTVVGGVGFTGLTPEARMFVFNAEHFDDLNRTIQALLCFEMSSGPQRSLGAVPEPATWAFMITGFGAIGGAMRKTT